MAVKEAVEEVEAAPFQMPLPRLHQFVSFFPHAQRNLHPHPALVVGVSPTAVSLISFSHGNPLGDLGEVRHVDDPFLQGNSLVRRRDGGWDFTEYDKALTSQQKIASERMAALERRLDNLRAELGEQ